MISNECGVETSNLIHDIHKRGVKKIAVIIRHSARHFDKAENDYLMGLTEQGKELSHKFGTELPTGLVLRFFSSPLNRCIETASLIETGYLSKGGKTETNKVSKTLGIFFAKDGKKAIKTIYKMGAFNFIREWFKGKISSDIVDDAEEASQKLIDFLLMKLQEQQENHIDVCVSHDLNLNLIKKYCLGVDDKELESVEYLEGVVIYKHKKEFYITNNQRGAKVLDTR